MTLRSEPQLMWIESEPTVMAHGSNAAGIRQLPSSIEYDGCEEETLKSCIQDAEVVSFDFFDTIVTRYSASPEAVQQYVGYLLSLEDPFLAAFFGRRKRAEDAARARHPGIGDVDLDMIYAQFPADEHWTSEVIATAHHLEQELETRFALPRFDIARLLEYARKLNKRVIVVSDSYFSREFLEKILEKLCLRTFIDQVYVSSEQKARKDNGSLWCLVAARERASGKRLVHFGDNPHADDAMARVHGFRCVQLMNPLCLAATRGFRYEANRDWRSDILFGPLLARYGNSPIASLSEGEPCKITAEEELGYVLYGPILLAFFAWLTETPALKRLNRLYFAAREGYFLQKLYDTVRARFGFDDLPPSRYLPISRRAVNTASQTQDFDPWRVIDGGGYHGTVEDFIKARLGLELQWPSRFIFPVSLPQDREYLARVLSILRPHIVSMAEQERDAMLCYCEQAGLLEKEMTGVVDAGYSGTIQSGLQMVLDRPLVGFYMLTSPRAAKVKPGGGLAFGCFQDALYDDMRPDAFMRKTLLLEALLTAPHGQLAKFEKDPSGGARPVYLENGVSQNRFHYLEKIFEGALNYCVDSIQSGGREVLGAIVPVRVNAFRGLDAVLSGDIRVSQEIASSLYLEDNFTGNGEIPCIP